MPPTIEELAAQVEALAAALAEAQKPPPLPEVNPLWGVRTCQVCGAEAAYIDARDETRKVIRNGEGYCAEHVPAEVLAGEHLAR